MEGPPTSWGREIGSWGVACVCPPSSEPPSTPSMPTQLLGPLALGFTLPHAGFCPLAPMDQDPHSACPHCLCLFSIQHVTVLVLFLCPLLVLPYSAGGGLPFFKLVSPSSCLLPRAPRWMSWSACFTSLCTGLAPLSGPWSRTADGHIC